MAPPLPMPPVGPMWGPPHYPCPLLVQCGGPPLPMPPVGPMWGPPITHAPCWSTPVGPMWGPPITHAPCWSTPVGPMWGPPITYAPCWSNVGPPITHAPCWSNVGPPLPLIHMAPPTDGEKETFIASEQGGDVSAGKSWAVYQYSKTKLVLSKAPFVIAAVLVLLVGIITSTHPYVQPMSRSLTCNDTSIYEL